MLDKKLLEELKEYVERHRLFLEIRESSYNIESPILHSEKYTNDLEDFIENNRKPTLQQVLFGYIDRMGVTDADIYKKAGLDRRHFSKIRSNADYRPKKSTTIALAIALELDKIETDNLLTSAGYSLSASDTYDLVIQFHLERKIYDFHQVNLALDHYRLKPLGGLL